LLLARLHQCLGISSLRTARVASIAFVVRSGTMDIGCVGDCSGADARRHSVTTTVEGADAVHTDYT
jgi:hypothetical protein